MDILLIPISFLIDQYCKKRAEIHLSNKSKSIIGNRINLSLVFNEGAFLGFMKKKKSILKLINVMIVIFLGLFYIKSYTKQNKIFNIGMALILGGGISNIYDRIYRKKVVDYFSFSIKPRIYFNLADMFIFLGSFLMVVS
jgi:signal peptidase II